MWHSWSFFSLVSSRHGTEVHPGTVSPAGAAH